MQTPAGVVAVAADLLNERATAAERER